MATPAIWTGARRSHDAREVNDGADNDDGGAGSEQRFESERVAFDGSPGGSPETSENKANNG